MSEYNKGDLVRHKESECVAPVHSTGFGWVKVEFPHIHIGGQTFDMPNKTAEWKPEDCEFVSEAKPKCRDCEYFHTKYGATCCWKAMRFDPICGMAGCEFKREDENSEENGG